MAGMISITHTFPLFKKTPQKLKQKQSKTKQNKATN
jgi:hypothetical protein